LVFAGLDSLDIASARDCVNQLFNSNNNIRECVKALAMIGEKS